MEYFIKQPGVLRCFCSDEEFSVLNVGYDNFYFVKPIKTFRRQNFYTWHFVLSGEGTLEIENKKYTVKSGEVFFIPPDTKMRYYPDKRSPWEYVWFGLKGKLSERYSELIGISIDNPICPIQQPEQVKKVLKRMLDQLVDGGGGRFSALSAFYEIMNISTTQLELTGIQQVKHLLDENFATPTFSIGRLCEDVSISHAHLLRLFKQEYGVTLIQYITKKRIDLACELLRTTNLSVGSVAYSCGFSDEVHFMKTFKKAVGVSATQYRRTS